MFYLTDSVQVTIRVSCINRIENIRAYEIFVAPSKSVDWTNATEITKFWFEELRDNDNWTYSGIKTLNIFMYNNHPRTYPGYTLKGIGFAAKIQNFSL